MNTRNQSATQSVIISKNISASSLEIAPGHGPEAVLWIVVDALLLVAIVTGNSLSVAIILRAGRRRQRSKKSTISESTHTSNATSAARKQHSSCEAGMHGSEHENPETTPNYGCKSGARSSCRFVLSLAMSDLLVGLAMPFHMAFYIQGADGGGSPLLSGEEGITLGKIKWACLLRFVLISLACSASACNLLAIAVDRYLAIVYPLHYCRYMTKRVAIMMIISCWGTALVFATIPAYWNRWATASLCELDDLRLPPRKLLISGAIYRIFTPQYITCVVAPLFGAVVVALSILYWRIGKEARAQLKRLLGADGKGPPWRRRQSGKTYCSSITVPDGEGEHNRTPIQNHTNTQIVDEEPMMLNENDKINDNPEHLRKERWKSGRHTREKTRKLSTEENYGSSDCKTKDLERFKKVNKLPYLQEVDEEHDPLENTNCDHDSVLHGGITKKQASQVKLTFLNHQSTQLQETKDNFLSTTETGKIFKCQSDPNLATFFIEDRLIGGRRAKRDIQGLNNQINCHKEVTEYKIKSNSYSNISPLNNILKERRNSASRSLNKNHHKCQSIMNHSWEETLLPQCSKNINKNNFCPKKQLASINADFREKRETTHNFMQQKMSIERKDTDLTDKSGGLNKMRHAMPNTLMTNLKQINKPRELIISVDGQLTETTIKPPRSSATEDTTTTVLQEKSKGLEEETVTKYKLEQNVTLNGSDKNYREAKPNNLDADRLKDCSYQDDQHHVKCLTCSLGKGYCDRVGCKKTAEPLENEDCQGFPSKGEMKDNHGRERHVSRMRSISSSSSSHGGRRNSNWNIRIPSLTGGSASIRPHISKSTIVVFLVLGSFVLMWLPYITVSSLLVQGVKLPYTLYRLTFSLAMSNSGVNPIIYGWKNAELKRVFLRFLLNRWYQWTNKWKFREEEQVPVTGTLNDGLDTTEASSIS